MRWELFKKSLCSTNIEGGSFFLKGKIHIFVFIGWCRDLYIWGWNFPHDWKNNNKTKRFQTFLVQFWLQFKKFLKANLRSSCPWLFISSSLQLTAPSVQPVKVFVVLFKTKSLNLAKLEKAHSESCHLG